MYTKKTNQQETNIYILSKLILQSLVFYILHLFCSIDFDLPAFELVLLFSTY